jgi:hypothetical protein
VHEILSLLPWLEYCCVGYSADTAQRNTLKGSYAYNIALLTTNLASASWYNRLWWIYVCPSGGYSTYGLSYFFLINHELHMTPCNSAVTHRVLQILNSASILCHAVSSNARACTHNDFV